MARRKKLKVKLSINYVLIAFIIIMLLEMFCYFTGRDSFFSNAFSFGEQQTYSIDMIPEYTGKGYVIINNNEPEFTEKDYTTNSFEQYSNLDILGRCGVAYANIGKDLMPTKERESIGMVKPSGWHTVKYDNVDGKYLYNRCHLIGYQLTGENANEKNLITCTRQMNTGAMLQYENEVTNYIKKTSNHVYYPLLRHLIHPIKHQFNHFNYILSFIFFSFNRHIKNCSSLITKWDDQWSSKFITGE